MLGPFNFIIGGAFQLNTHLFQSNEIYAPTPNKSYTGKCFAIHNIKI